MIAFPESLFEIDPCPAYDGQDRAGGVRHIADVLEELFERFPIPALEFLDQEVEEPAVV